MANTLHAAPQPETPKGTTNWPRFPSLDGETRATLDTETTAYHLNRASQTLRIWACKEIGPIRPLRIHGRLAWPTAEIRRLLGVTE